MTLTAGRILRSKNVKLEGCYRLDFAPALGSGTQNVRHVTGQTLPKVRIAQKGNDFAIIEVACGCGEMIQIKCNYAGANLSAKPTGQENVQETQNAVS
jgi:hypothetical protein